MFGHVVETFDLLPGIQAAGNALLIITSSYNGKLIDQLTADKLLFPGGTDLKRFVHNFLEKLNKMKECAKFKMN